jgi:phospholipase/carboxylesterase
MDRTEQAAKPPETSDSGLSLEIGSSLFRTTTRGSSYAIFTPLHYEPKYGYPLIVWLHGQGSDERQLLRIMPMLSMRNYVAVAPQGTRVERTAAGRQTYRWDAGPAHLEQAEQRIFDAIEAAQRRLHIARRRVFVAGFDGGGTMAFRVAMNHPAQFAGVLSICGLFPSGRTPFGHLTEARRLPVFFAIGRDSGPCPPEKVCENLRLFHAAGMSVTLRQYPCGHELAPQMLNDMDRWIIDQVTSLAETTT